MSSYKRRKGRKGKENIIREEKRGGKERRKMGQKFKKISS